MFLSSASGHLDPAGKLDPGLDMQHVLRAYAMHGLLPGYISSPVTAYSPPPPCPPPQLGSAVAPVSPPTTSSSLYAMPRTWHPHVYENSARKPTPHRISDILGMRSDRTGSGSTHPRPSRGSPSPSYSEASGHSSDSGLPHEHHRTDANKHSSSSSSPSSHASGACKSDHPRKYFVIFYVYLIYFCSSVFLFTEFVWWWWMILK